MADVAYNVTRKTLYAREGVGYPGGVKVALRASESVSEAQYLACPHVTIRHSLRMRGVLGGSGGVHALVFVGFGLWRGRPNT